MGCSASFSLNVPAVNEDQSYRLLYQSKTVVALLTVDTPESSSSTPVKLLLFPDYLAWLPLQGKGAEVCVKAVVHGICHDAKPKGFDLFKVDFSFSDSANTVEIREQKSLVKLIFSSLLEGKNDFEAFKQALCEQQSNSVLTPLHHMAGGRLFIEKIERYLKTARLIENRVFRSFFMKASIEVGSCEETIYLFLCKAVFNLIPYDQLVNSYVVKIASIVALVLEKFCQDPFIAVILATVPLSDSIFQGKDFTLHDAIEIICKATGSEASEQQSPDEFLVTKHFILRLYGWESAALQGKGIDDVRVIEWLQGLLPLFSIKHDELGLHHLSFPSLINSSCLPIATSSHFQALFSNCSSLFLVRAYAAQFAKKGAGEELSKAMTVLERSHFQYFSKDDFNFPAAVPSLLEVIFEQNMLVHISKVTRIMLEVSAFSDTNVQELLRLRDAENDNIRAIAKLVRYLLYDDTQYHPRENMIRAYPKFLLIAGDAVRQRVPHHLNKDIDESLSDILRHLISFEGVIMTNGCGWRNVPLLSDEEHRSVLDYLREKDALVVFGKVFGSYLNSYMSHSFMNTSPSDVSKSFINNAVFGFLVWSIKTAPAIGDNFMLSALCKRLDTVAFFSAIFGADQLARTAFSHWYARLYDFSDAILQAMITGLLLTRYEHFQQSVRDAFSFKARNLDVDQFLSIIRVALKIASYDNMKGPIERIDKAVALNCEKLLILQMISNEVLSDRRSEDSFLSEDGFTPVITLDGVSACCEAACQALRVFSRDARQQGAHRLREVFPRFLQENPPDAWLAFFKSSIGIAVFLKYIDQEDLENAYSAFNHDNSATRDSVAVLSILTEVEKIYAEPFFHPQTMAIAEEGAINRVIAGLLDASRREFSRRERAVALEISARWIEKSREMFTVGMPPRNAQFITFFFVAQWLKQRQPISALLAQVGTGEGKSLIIAMISIYIVRVLNKKVHIMVNNQGLLNRDFATFADFYSRFGITVSKGKFGSAQVVYCMRSQLEQFYRDHFFAGCTTPFRDTFLVVDEVDALIIDDDSSNSYVKVDKDYGLLVKDYFDQIKKNPDLSSYGDNPTICWKKCKKAYSTARSKTLEAGLPNGYSVNSTGEYRMNDEYGRIQENTYALWLEYLNYIKNEGSDYVPKYKTVYYVQSLLQMVREYECIVGLSGVLGSDQEREHLARTYNTTCVHTPAFLDTCKNVKKEKAKLINDTVFVFPTDDQQMQEAATKAEALAAAVPVLIICKSMAFAVALYKFLNVSDETAKQLLLENDPKDCTHMPWDQIVELATTPRDRGGVGYRITITDYWGGRGFDYRISDPDVSMSTVLP